MDALDLLYPVASELLSRSDSVLARSGAPEGHEILRLLRLAGRLPGDLVAEVAAWDPALLDERAAMLREQAHRHREIAADLSRPMPWEGKAASAFGARLTAAARQSEELASSAATLAVQFTELAAWLRVARRQLAQTLASVLSSAEAVTLSVPSAPLERSAAAVRLGTVVLRDAERFHSACADFAATWPKPVTPIGAEPLALPAPILRVEGLG